MSERDVELLRDGFSTLAVEGYESLMPLVHPEFEMTTPPGIAAEPQTYQGEEGLRRWWESFYEVMDEVRVEPTKFHDAGEGRVVVEAVLRATGQTSGLEVDSGRLHADPPPRRADAPDRVLLHPRRGAGGAGSS